ncbi:PREDICTED: uncharacterized protein LOC106814457 [Priapulus caudatus]|uniref:Uncharacterized protein LOC106814457 n=1 Tax=Priapulus caudatus TaxID=37621 RepID=A0ABM1EPZ1_PRICU|nr:PREDICTED: uncharacterized protein LOC106814457 [Priapulus caudatus]
MVSLSFSSIVTFVLIALISVLIAADGTVAQWRPNTRYGKRSDDFPAGLTVYENDIVRRWDPQTRYGKRADFDTESKLNIAGVTNQDDNVSDESFSCVHTGVENLYRCFRKS